MQAEAAPALPTDFPGSTLQVIAVNDTSDSLLLDINFEGTNVATVTAFAVGFSDNSILVSSTNQNGLAEQLTDEGLDPAIVSESLAALSTAGLPSGTIVDYTATSTSNLACFLRGTRILTPAGEVAVETLAIGDLVATAAGAARPVRWIGRRSYTRAVAEAEPELLPIRIAAGALAEAVPARDLWVSPRHALLLQGVLVPAGELVNGASITVCREAESIDYFHIELDQPRRDHGRRCAG